MFVIFLLLLMTSFIYGIDLLARPFVRLFTGASRCFRWVRGVPEEIVIASVHDLDWFGPATQVPTTNALYRDHIRARSKMEGAQLSPKNLVIYNIHDGTYARLSRPSGQTRPANRDGQLWQIDKILACNSNLLHEELNETPGKLVCLCREMLCRRPEAAYHVKAYAGVDAHTHISLGNRPSSPLCLCLSKGASLLWQLRYGCKCCPLPCCCRRRKPVVTRKRSTRDVKHPDSESDREGGCMAEQIAWKDNGGKLHLLCGTTCNEAPSDTSTALLEPDTHVSDVKDCENYDGATWVHLCPHHATAYEGARSRFCCPVNGCHREAVTTVGHITYCGYHAELYRPPPAQPPRFQGASLDPAPRPAHGFPHVPQPVADRPTETQGVSRLELLKQGSRGFLPGLSPPLATVTPNPGTRTTANPSGRTPSSNDVVLWIYAPTAQSKAPRYFRFAGIIEDRVTTNGTPQVTVHAHALPLHRFTVPTAVMGPWTPGEKEAIQSETPYVIIESWDHSRPEPYNRLDGRTHTGSPISKPQLDRLVSGPLEGNRESLYATLLPKEEPPPYAPGKQDLLDKLRRVSRTPSPTLPSSRQELDVMIDAEKKRYDRSRKASPASARRSQSRETTISSAKSDEPDLLDLYLDEMKNGGTDAAAIASLGAAFDLEEEDVLSRLLSEIVELEKTTDNVQMHGMLGQLREAWVRQLQVADPMPQLIPLASGRYKSESPRAAVVTNREPPVLVRPQLAATLNLEPVRHSTLPIKVSPPSKFMPASAPDPLLDRIRAGPPRLQARPLSPASTMTPRAAGPDEQRLAAAAEQQASIATDTNSALKSVAAAVDAFRRAHEDDSKIGEGSMAHLRATSTSQLVYLARGLDTFDVQVCEGLTGRELYDNIKRAGDCARDLMSKVNWPTPITNRMAYGITSLSWGGRTGPQALQHCLTAADFPWTSQEVFDDWIPTEGNQREIRAKYPQTVAVWKRQTDNEIKVFSLVYGAEHAAERRASATA